MDPKIEFCILRIYRSLYDGRGTKNIFGKLKDLQEIMEINKMIEETPGGLSFTPKYKQKFFDYENFEKWIKENYVEPLETEKKSKKKRGELKKYTNNSHIESIIKSLLPESEIIDLKIDPQNPYYYLVVVKDNDKEKQNNMWDSILERVFVYLFKLNDNMITPVDTGQALVKYFPHIIKDLGYSDEAIYDMQITKSWNNWRKYKSEEWDYNNNLKEGLFLDKFNSFPFKEKFIASAEKYLFINDYEKMYYSWFPNIGNIYFGTRLDGEKLFIIDKLGYAENLNDAKKIIKQHYLRNRGENYPIYYNDLDEELEGRLNQKAVLSNPKLHELLSKDLRGFITEEGDFYIINSDSIIHGELVQYLTQLGKLPKIASAAWHLNPKMAKCLGVQRSGNTNNFFVSISIDRKWLNDNKEWVDSIFKKAKEKNPEYKFTIDPVEVEKPKNYVSPMAAFYQKEHEIISLDNFLKEHKIIPLDDFLNEVDIDYLIKMNRQQLERPWNAPRSTPLSQQSQSASDRYDYGERKEGLSRIARKQQILKDLGYDLDTDEEDPLKAVTRSEAKKIEKEYNDYKNKMEGKTKNPLVKNKLANLRSRLARAKYGLGKFSELKKDYDEQDRKLKQLYKKHERDSLLDSTDSWDNIIPTLDEYAKSYNQEILDELLNIKHDLRIINNEILKLKNKQEASEEYLDLLDTKRKLELEAFKLRKNLFQSEPVTEMEGGKGNKKDSNLFDKDQLRLGTAVEMEHTNDPKIATDIAKDHLTEDKDYYMKLIKCGLVDEEKALNIYKTILNTRKKGD